MFYWAAKIIGIAFALFQIFYAYIVINSLLENTGSMLFSIITGSTHAVTPILFVYFAYQCLLQKAAQHGMLKAVFGMVVCFVIYFFIVSVWNRIVLFDVSPTWKVGVLTAVQVVISAVFIYGFLSF